MEITPTARMTPTASAPSCQARMLSTSPPIPRTDRTAPTRSISRFPVYGTSLTSRLPSNTIAMTTTSSRNATRYDRNVVMKPPISGPTAAAIAAEAPTRAYVAFWAAPSKLPWMSDCMAGSRRDAPRPPMIAQKMMIAARLWPNAIARAPMA